MSLKTKPTLSGLEVCVGRKGTTGPPRSRPLPSTRPPLLGPRPTGAGYAPPRCRSGTPGFSRAAPSTRWPTHDGFLSWRGRRAGTKAGRGLPSATPPASGYSELLSSGRSVGKRTLRGQEQGRGFKAHATLTSETSRDPPGFTHL